MACYKYLTNDKLSPAAYNKSHLGKNFILSKTVSKKYSAGRNGRRRNVISKLHVRDGSIYRKYRYIVSMSIYRIVSYRPRQYQGRREFPFGNSREFGQSQFPVGNSREFYKFLVRRIFFGENLDKIQQNSPKIVQSNLGLLHFAIA